jgi:AcrR family transcriptional regulator
VARPSGETTTARGQARREALIDVALRAFAAHGYRGASIGAIAKEAGISEPGLLHHFPSKRHLLLGVLDHLSLNFRQTDERLDANSRSFCDALLSLARFHEADATLVRLFVVLGAESVNPEHPAHEYFSAWYEKLRATFAAGFASDQEHGFVVPEADPAVMARVVISILDGLRLQLLLSDGDLQIAAPLETFLITLRSSAN